MGHPRAAVVAKNLALERELWDAQGCLRKRGIRVAVLKGFPLLRRLGLPLGDRELADNDLLVLAADVRRADQALREMGYVDASRRTLENALKVDFQHRLRRDLPSGRSALLELHWLAFTPRLYRVPAAFEWSHMQTLSIDGNELEAFDPPLTLLHTAAHYVQHGFAELRILVVLGQAWRHWGETHGNQALAIATQLNMLPTLEYCLACAAGLGFAEAVPLPTTPRARLLLRALPPERLVEDRPHPDHLRELLSLLLVAPAKALPVLGHKVLPELTEAREFTGSSDPWQLFWCYLDRPRRVARHWSEYRRQLAAARRGRAARR